MNPKAFAQHYGAESGMDLRDYFAAKALPIAFDFVRRIDAESLIGMSDPTECRYDISWTNDEDGPSSDIAMVAEYAYIMADAMLKARQA